MKGLRPCWAVRLLLRGTVERVCVVEAGEGKESGARRGGMYVWVEFL